MSDARGLAPVPKRTNPLGFVASGVQALQRGVLPMLAVGWGMRDEGIGLIVALGVGLLLALFGGGMAYLKWRKLTYTLGETDIRVESGIVSRATRSVPFERIQDVSLEQALVPRLFGLVEVRFETGAGGKDELKLAYLSEKEGEALRDVVRARKDGVTETISEADTQTGTVVEAPPSVLFAMNTQRLLTFGLFEFSLAVVAVVAGAAQQFDFLLPFDIWDWGGWKDLLAEPGGRLEHLGFALQVIGALAALAALAMIGIISGIGKTVLRDWGFRLEQTAKGFRRRRGLLTRTDVVMPVHRVQAARVTTGILRRRFGWHGLSFVSLAQDSGAGNHVVAPFGTMAELEPIIRAARFDPPDVHLDWQRGSARYRLDGALLAGAILVPAAALVAATGRPWLAMAPILGAAFLTLRGVFLWRFERNALSPKQLFIGSGWLAPTLAIANRVKLQSVEISQSFIGRWRGYVTLQLGLAGGTMALHGISEARARELRKAILASITATDFSELAD